MDCYLVKVRLQKTPMNSTADILTNLTSIHSLSDIQAVNRNKG